MTPQEKDNILTKIVQIKALDFDHVLSSAFPNAKNLEEQKIGQYSIPEFKTYLNRALLQLERQLEGDDFIFLQRVLNNAYGTQVDLFQSLDSIVNSVNSNQINGLAGPLYNLVAYQMAYGFWDKSTTKTHDPKTLDFDKRLSVLELIGLDVKQFLKALSKKEAEIDELKNEFSKFMSEKKSTLIAMDSLLSQAKDQSGIINSLLQDSQTNKAKIEEIFNIQNKLLDDIRGRIEEERTKFERLNDLNDKSIKKIEQTNRDSEAKFEDFKKKLDEIEAKRDYIEKLTGMAADGALGNRFYSRQDELKKSIRVWGGISVLSVFATVGWIFFVFNEFHSSFGIEWINLAVYILKTLPAFFLLAFAMRQYVKERNLQEEYAYRAAVAMTITAYSELLKEADKEGNASRQRMLLDTIQKIYSSPRIHRIVDDKIFSLSTRDLRDTVKELTSSVKELKDGLLK